MNRDGSGGVNYQVTKDCCAAVKQRTYFNELEYRQLEELKDLFEFIDDIIPDSSDEEIEAPKRGSRKRYARLCLTVFDVLTWRKALREYSDYHNGVDG